MGQWIQKVDRQVTGVHSTGERITRVNGHVNEVHPTDECSNGYESG